MEMPSSQHCISFSQMKLMKSQLRSRLSEISLTQLMKIVIEGPKTSQKVTLNRLLVFGTESLNEYQFE